MASRRRGSTAGTTSRHLFFAIAVAQSFAAELAGGPRRPRLEATDDLLALRGSPTLTQLRQQRSEGARRNRRQWRSWDPPSRYQLPEGMKEPETDGPLIVFLNKRDREYLKDVKFTHKAIWARPLAGQWYMELSRALVDVVTLGFFEFSRRSAGNCYHWAFVVRGQKPETWLSKLFNRSLEDSYVYLVVQDNLLLPHNLRKISDKKHHKMRRFTLHMGRNMQEATWAMGCGRKRGFVKYPKSGYGKNPRLNLDRSWTLCKEPRSLEDLLESIQVNPSAQKPYGLQRNNCQHFSSWLYHDVRDRGRRPRMNKRRGNPALV